MHWTHIMNEGYLCEYSTIYKQRLNKKISYVIICEPFPLPVTY